MEVLVRRHPIRKESHSINQAPRLLLQTSMAIIFRIWPSFPTANWRCSWARETGHLVRLQAILPVVNPGRFLLLTSTTTATSMSLCQARRGLSISAEKEDGTFNPGGFLDCSAKRVSSSTAADFNGDGSVDIITGTLLQLLILLGKGDGTFTAQPVFQIKETAGTVLLAGAADFNGDGKLDLFAVQDVGYVWMTLGNGDGTFVQDPTHHRHRELEPRAGCGFQPRSSPRPCHR